MVRDKPTAGLPLSVGSASVPVRLLIAAVFSLVAGISIASGVHLAESGSAATAVAVLIVIPFGLIASLGALFVVAPLSAFGRWLDEFLGGFSGVRALLVVALLWLLAAMMIAVSGGPHVR